MSDPRARLRVVKAAFRPMSTGRTGAQEIAQQEFVDYLFRRYRQPLLGYLIRLRCTQEDADEILQEAYCRIMRAGHLDHIEARARSYLYRIATNLVRDKFRSESSRAKAGHVPLDDLQLSSEAPSPDHLAEWNDGLQKMKQCILTLPPRCRRIFLLHAVENLAIREIAAALGVSTKTVQRDLVLALEFCQSKLGV